mgnify:CR=1 FL=1
MHTNQALRAYGCAECTFLTCQGFERYCGGFPEKRKPKRFLEDRIPSGRLRSGAHGGKPRPSTVCITIRTTAPCFCQMHFCTLTGKGMALLHLSATGTTLWLRRGRHSFRPGSF